MLLHASCAARDGHGVLLLGGSGVGKSDLLLRLLSAGFILVADDQVHIHEQDAKSPAPLAGLLEVRGLGVVRLPYLPSARLALAVRLERGVRMPQPELHAIGVPLIAVDPERASAPARIALALDCALGRCQMIAGSFA